MPPRQRVALTLFALLAIPVLALMIRGFLDPSGSWHPWRALTAERVDGAWAAVALDGKPAPWREYRLSVTGGKVAGGRDGCNDWGFADDPPYPNGERMIVSTLQACPEEDPLRKAYWALARTPRLELRPDGRLRVSAPGHEAIFRRCRWRTERSSTELSFSQERLCRPD